MPWRRAAQTTPFMPGTVLPSVPGRPERTVALLLVLLALVACAPQLAAPTPTWPPLTRVISVSTDTPTPPPPSHTPTSTATVTPTPTPSPVPPSPTPTPPPVARLMAVGDIMLARSIGDRLLANGAAWPFAAVAPVMTDADLLVGNLECVIGDQGEPEPKAYVFQAPPIAVDALANVGFDVVSLSNNHALDFGVDGLADMLPRLEAAGIQSVGAGADEAAARRPILVEHHGLTIAFLAYVDVPVEGRSGFDTRLWIAGPSTPGLAWAEAEAMQTDIQAAVQQADLVVVMLHFGLEGRSEVSEAQARTARAAIDAGAALVIGSHAHVLQPVEAYNGGLIVYNLGNFVFDGFTGLSNYSAIFTATLTPDGIADFDFVPVVVEQGVPRLATSDEAAVILARLQYAQ